MSLINDALRRAQEARPQQPASPAAGPPLHPVPSAPARRPGLGLALGFACLLALAAALIWLGVQQSQQPQTVANQPAQAIPVAAATAPPAPPASPPPVALPPPERPSTSSAPPAVPSEAASQPAAAAPAGPPPAVSAQGSASPGDTARPLAEARPAPPKLQGIIFHPTRPSAVLNGRLLFVGERLGEWRVTAIDARSVTVVSAGQTNVLELP